MIPTADNHSSISAVFQVGGLCIFCSFSFRYLIMTDKNLFLQSVFQKKMFNELNDYLFQIIQDIHICSEEHVI